MPARAATTPHVEATAPIRLPDHARILVVKAAGLGDLLLALPAIRALRQTYPQARIDLLCAPPGAALVRESPLIDHVWTVDKTRFDSPHASFGALLGAPRQALALGGLALRLRQARYDAVLLLHHLTLPFGRVKYRLLLAAARPVLAAGLDNGHGAFLDLRVPDAGFGARHEAAYCLDVARAVGARLPDAPDAPDAPPAPRLADLGWDDIEIARAGAPPTHAEPLVALHVGSGTYSVARRWPLNRFVALAHALHGELGARIVLIGGDDERALVAEAAQALGAPPWVAVSAPGATLRETAAHLSRCDLFVGNDAFPMHLAAAAGTPVLAIFGPSNAPAWRPLPRDARAVVSVVRRDLPCSPCFYRGHELGTPQGCPPRPCLEDLPVAQVLREARRMLARTRAASAAPAGPPPAMPPATPHAERDG